MYIYIYIYIHIYTYTHTHIMIIIIIIKIANAAKGAKSSIVGRKSLRRALGMLLLLV